MIEIYKSNPEESAIIKIDQPEKNCWINLTHPSGDEIGKIASELQILG